jgi:hypothetical protein
LARGERNRGDAAVKARRRRADFIPSPELLAAAQACGRLSDVAARKAMRSAKTRQLIRAEQYRQLMQHKARLPSEAAAVPQPPSPLERQDVSSPWPARDGTEAPGNPGDCKMDMTKFGGDQYLKVEDIRASGPVRATIEAIKDGPFDKPVASLSDGSALQLNVSNTRTLIRTWGKNSEDWLGREIELEIDQVDFKGEPTDSIVVRPISAAIPISERKTPSAPEIDDDIPF